MRISSSRVFRSSFDAFLNSARLLPSDRPSSGSFRGPKMIRAITKMMISSGIPIEPNICPAFLETDPDQERGGPVIIGTGSRPGQGIPAGANAQKSLFVRKLSARMAIMRRYRPVTAVVFAIVVSALVGGLFGRNALATDDRIPEHYRAFTAALNAIETSYVDKVDSEQLVTSSIRGMLATLDPHSSYFTPREYAQMRERQEGR